MWPSGLIANTRLSSMSEAIRGNQTEFMVSDIRHVTSNVILYRHWKKFMGQRTIREVAGYGASLRNQLRAIGWSQARLATAGGVSRQTISRAINQNRVSARTEELIATALARGSQAGSASRTKRSSGRPAGGTRRSPIRSATLCDATDLEAWANRREAQGLLPGLVRRLVFATGRGVRELQFRDGEGVQLSGWDGIVRATEDGLGNSPFVPRGVSGWEMGAGAEPHQKAERDLRTRTEKPEPLDPEGTTFVFVTPRRWRKKTEVKEKWTRRKTDEGPWHRVQVIDADDLVTWMEQAPAVHAWFSRRIGKTPRDSIDLESYWQEWAGATRPPLTRRFLLAGREKEVREIRNRLGEAGQSFAIRAESRNEAVAVLYCVIRELSPDEAEQVLARSVVVESRDAFRQLTAFPTRLLLVPAPAVDAGELVSAAAHAGHTIVVPRDEADAEDGDGVELPRLWKDTAAEALREHGLGLQQAYRMAALARRSLTAFRRRIASSPGVRLPGWSKPSVSRTLLPALFAGSWTGARAGDREVLARLGRCRYEEVQDRVLEWSVGSDPAIRRRDDAWYLVSHEDAWRLLRRYLTRDDLGRFEDIAVEVLGTRDPAFDVPPDQRWMAGAIGASAKYSGLLKNGLAKTLLVMGLQEDNLPFAGYSERDVSEQVVRKLLEAANEDWKIWASLSNQLRQLAEAAPDAFLDGVENGLEGAKPALARLFTDDRSTMFSSPPHPGLLHALETLAWSQDYVGRVVPLFARLDHVDPGSTLRPTNGHGGRSADRPLASLKGVFRSWQPQTSATLEQRLQLLDRLREKQSEVAWSVMLSMLPELLGSSFPSAQPVARDWADHPDRVATPHEIVTTTKEVVARLREDAGCDAKRWTELLKHLHMLPHDEHMRVVEDLEKLGSQALDERARSTIWEALRALVARHRIQIRDPERPDFPRRTKWAMPEERLVRLDEIRDRFAPRDPVARFGWLFGHNPRFLHHADPSETSWETRQETLRAERIEALNQVVRAHGLYGLRRFASAVNQPYEVGRAAASIHDVHLFADELLSRHLADPSQALEQLAFGYAVGRANENGDDWVIRQLQRVGLKLSADQRAAMLCALPTTPETWALAANYGDATRLAYWRRMAVHSIAPSYAADAALALSKAGRPFVAADLLASQQESNVGVPPEVIAEVLEAAVAAETAYDQPTKGFSGFAYSTELLLNALLDADFDKTQVARFEWALLPFVNRFDWHPRALHHLLAESPEFFVKVVSRVYRAEGDAPRELDKQERQHASAGHSLLKSWRTVPAPPNAGHPSRSHLRKWISSAEKALRDAGRFAIGRYAIGEMLSGSPADRDGTWPCSAVREVIEELASTDLENGFEIGLYNNGGGGTKDPTLGGERERAQVERYEGLAAAVRFSHPRTARLLRRIANQYRDDAGWEDHRSGMLEDLD